MENSSVDLSAKAMGKSLKAFVRARAIKHGTYIIYEENGIIIKENPRTGEKQPVIPAPSK